MKFNVAIVGCMVAILCATMPACQQPVTTQPAQLKPNDRLIMRAAEMTTGYIIAKRPAEKRVAMAIRLSQLAGKIEAVNEGDLAAVKAIALAELAKWDDAEAVALVRPWVMEVFDSAVEQNGGTVAANLQVIADVCLGIKGACAYYIPATLGEGIRVGDEVTL